LGIVDVGRKPYDKSESESDSGVGKDEFEEEEESIDNKSGTGGDES
jgi:hypothetical protein